jgi:hypothetical protein
MVVSRDTLPTGLTRREIGLFSRPYYDVQPYTPANQLAEREPVAINSWADWTGCGTMLPMLAMGMGNPLQAGTYYIGVQDPNNASSYTLQSRGIGLTNYTIRVKDLASSPGARDQLGLGGGRRGLLPGARCRATRRTGSCNLQCGALGEVLLKVQKDYLPNSGYSGYNEYDWPYGYVESGLGGQLMMKPGDEQWALLPQNGNNYNWAEPSGWNEFDGRDVLCAGGQPGAEPD